MKSPVRAKKHLGQHFLIDLNIAKDITEAVEIEDNNTVIEVGPGTGVLTQYLKERKGDLVLSEIDQESIAYLTSNMGFTQKDFVGDFLQYDLSGFDDGSVIVIGNYPYNISTQIFFKILDNRDKVKESVGMLQKEVAERICSPEGSKVYGIMSVLIQAFFDVEYLFTVHEDVFDPPPRVKSGVIRIRRNDVTDLGVDYKKFLQTVKMAFSTRRKTLRNALKPLNLPKSITEDEMFSKRAEQLSVAQFIHLTKIVIAC